MNDDQPLFSFYGDGRDEEFFRFIRIGKVCRIFDCSRATVYNWVKCGLLPQPIRISQRSVGWLPRDIQHLVDQSRKRKLRKARQR